MEPLRDKVSRSSALLLSDTCKKQRADRSGPPVALGFVSQENFAVLTASFAIPIEFQTKLEVRQRTAALFPYLSIKNSKHQHRSRCGILLGQMLMCGKITQETFVELTAVPDILITCKKRKHSLQFW